MFLSVWRTIAQILFAVKFPGNVGNTCVLHFYKNAMFEAKVSMLV